MHQYLDSIFKNSKAENFINYAFNFNYNNCKLYRDYCNSINKETTNTNKLTDIPFLPIEFFKNHKIKTGYGKASRIFVSSGTTGKKSKHYVLDLKVYDQSLLYSFKYAFGDPKNFHFLGITPDPNERKNSSLIYMIDKLQKFSKNEGFSDNTFVYLEEFRLGRKEKKKLGLVFNKLFNGSTLARGDGELVRDFYISMTPRAGGLGSYKVSLNKKVFFINKSYAEANFEFLDCKRQEEFKLN